MTTKKYAMLVEKRGGVDAVAAALGCGRDRILRRTNGASKVTRESVLAVEALPVVEHWLTVSKLKRNPAFRRKFARRVPKLVGAEAETAIRLLAETVNQFKGTRGGSARARCKNR